MTTDTQEKYFSLLITLSLVSITLGAAVAGLVQQKQRRLVLMCSITISCSGLLLGSFVFDKYSFMIGFLLKNFGCGISYVVITKFVEEIVPDHLLGPYFSAIPLFSVLGFVVAAFMADILPSYDAPVDILVAN